VDERRLHLQSAGEGVKLIVRPKRVDYGRIVELDALYDAVCEYQIIDPVDNQVARQKFAC
jgi:hypothetical protein